jgi:homopolymeric O-antigen transport system permease protein
MFATPVAYPLAKAKEALPHALADIYVYVNPLVPVFDGFRSILAKGEWPQWGPLGVAAAVGLLGLLVAYRWYKRLDPNFADVV